MKEMIKFLILSLKKPFAKSPGETRRGRRWYQMVSAFSFLIAMFFFWSALAGSPSPPSPPSLPRTSASNSNPTPAGDSSFTPSQEAEIQKIVRNYLIKNPEILLEVSQILEKKQEAQAERDALAAIQTQEEQLFDDPKSPIAGNPKGAIQIVQFFDYQCGHCKTMAPIIESVINKHPNVKVIFKELPVFGGNSLFASKVALASVSQSKYYAFHKALFAAATDLNPKMILDIAKKVGLNTDQLKKDVSAPWIGAQIRNNFTLAQRMKLMGTPAFVIRGVGGKIRFVPGAMSQEKLDQLIADVSK